MSLTPKFTNEIKFTESLKGRLTPFGYNSTTFEDLIIEIISKGGASLADRVNELQTAVNNISTETLQAKATVAGLGTGSVDAVKITSRSVDYSVSEDSFTYSLDGLKANLPTGFQLVSSGVTVIDSNGKRSSVKGLGNSIKVPSFPATAKVLAVVKTANGVLELEKDIVLSANGSGASVLDVRDLTVAPADLKVSEMLSLLSAEISMLKQRF